MTGKFAAQAAAIQREQWEQYPDIMRYIYGSPPEQAAPERSGATGYNRTLTPRRKCGIIKSIKRCIRRWKRKQEGKTMKKLRVYIKPPYAFTVEVDGKEVYSTGKAKDIASYCKRHFGVDIPTETRNYPTGTKTHFDGLTPSGFEFDIE